jgi:putative toxin-antitoxin system antitoxin component (TIGR02293 family)
MVSTRGAPGGFQRRAPAAEEASRIRDGRGRDILEISTFVWYSIDICQEPAMAVDGLAAVLGVKGAGRAAGGAAIALAGAVRRGLPWKAIDNVKRELGLADEQLASYLGVSSKTLGRLRKGGRRHLNLVAGDRLYRLARIFAIAKDVLEGEEEARAWLRRPQIGLGNETPLELALTEAGAREVEDLLGRIEFGVVA